MTDPKIEENTELLRTLFLYDRRSPSGLRWNPKSRHIAKRATGVAGNKGNNGYWEVQVFGEKLTAHRIVWIILRGKIQEDLTVDHLDGNRGNNKISNLRVVSMGVNNRARNKMNRNNTSGFVGVGPSKGGRWRASVFRNGRPISLGCFDTAAEAAREHNRFVKEWAENYGEQPRYLNPV